MQPLSVCLFRCWSCCGTWPTGMTVPRTPWTTPSMHISRFLTTPAHKLVLSTRICFTRFKLFCMCVGIVTWVGMNVATTYLEYPHTFVLCIFPLFTDSYKNELFKLFLCGCWNCYVSKYECCYYLPGVLFLHKAFFAYVIAHCTYRFQERESQKLKWLQRCVEELGNEKWVIPALKQMREICLLYLEVCVCVCPLPLLNGFECVVVSTLSNSWSTNQNV
jgi:hypothetical protein